MITGIVILAVSTGLFVYWFRYSCLLILSAKTARDYSNQVASANGLHFLTVHGALQAGTGGAQLDTLQQALNKDYATLTAMTRYGLCFGAGQWLESAMVHIDFHLLRSWYFVARLAWPAQAQQTVSEMAEIVRYFANTAGERAQSSAI